MEYKTAYGPKDKVQLNGFEKSRTKQAMRDESNINFIVAKYQKTGMVEHLNKYQGDYAEFESIDYHEAMNLVVGAQQMFESLPSSVRSRFQNDPAQFLDFVGDGANATEMREMGLLKPERPTFIEPAPFTPPEEPAPEEPPA